MNSTRIINFLKRYLLKHPVYVITYVVTYFFRNFSFRELFYSQEEIKELIKEGKSIIRFGDGEINLMLDLRNHYHKYSPQLKKMMQEIVSEYSKKSPYILSIPRFINVGNNDLKKIGKFNVWLPIKVMFLLKFPKKVPYMDAHNFYYDNYFENVIAPEIKNKKIIYITKKETIENQKNNTNIPWKDIDWVETPEEDALGHYDVVVKLLDEKLSKLTKNDVLLLVAMGPVGKYLIFEYAKRGFQGIDVGVAIETIFTGKSLEHRI